jgi:hypothetical protein
MAWYLVLQRDDFTVPLLLIQLSVIRLCTDTEGYKIALLIIHSDTAFQSLVGILKVLTRMKPNLEWAPLDTVTLRFIYNYYKEQSPTWEANSCSVSKNFPRFVESEI